MKTFNSIADLQSTTVSPTYSVSARWVDSFTQETVLSIVFNNQADVGKTVTAVTLQVAVQGTGGHRRSAIELKVFN